MDVFVLYGKLGKKARRKIDIAKRRTWNGVDPVTRRTPDHKAYDRKRVRRGDDFPNGPFYLFPVWTERMPKASIF
jgi:hypothetical protein